MNKEKFEAVTLLLSDSRGVYIPRDFTQEFKLEMFGFTNERIEYYKKELSNPWKNEHYWEVWEELINNAVLTQDEKEFYLYQEGNLWLLCYDEMSEDEKENFGMSE